MALSKRESWYHDWKLEHTLVGTKNKKIDIFIIFMNFLIFFIESCKNIKIFFITTLNNWVATFYILITFEIDITTFYKKNYNIWKL